MNNKISITISGGAEKAILEKVAELAKLLPEGLITLTEEERRGLAMMGDKTVQFVDKALDLAAQNPMLLPPYIDPTDYTQFWRFSILRRQLGT